MKKQQKMRKYLLIILCVGALESHANRSFHGWYTGLGLAYSYTNIKIDGAAYKAKTPYLKLFGGWGKLEDRNYYGIEGALDVDQYAKKMVGRRLSKRFGFSLAGRIGRVTQENFLPFLKLGLRRDSYRLEKANPNNTFSAWMFVPAVGVDAFVEDWFLVRSEVEYSLGFATSGEKHKVSRKPKTLLVRAGAIFKF